MTAAASSTKLLRVRDLRTELETSRGRLVAVDGVDLDLDPRQTLGIVGESGSGKTMLVRTLMGLLPPAAQVSWSEFTYGGSAFDPFHPGKNVWGPEVAMVFQDPMSSLNPVRTIGRHLSDPLRLHLDLTRRTANERAKQLLADVGIPEPARRLKQYPHELSGGMRQRVMIAMAISCEPRLLIADEPTTALDVTVQRQILELLARLKAERRMAMILISHDLAVVRNVVDHIAVMYGGAFVEAVEARGLPETVQHPYTSALLASHPDVDAPAGSRPRGIPGRPPDLTQLPPGCRFAPRCAHARDLCVERDPEFVPQKVRPGAFACHFPVGDAGVSVRPSDDVEVR